ncbi:MAG TPA: UDP-N-acetylmuramoyl-L-alanyl-D-glutamate--2,6-diaminopimelate ligase [Tepidisphaeraceae bacterium]|nr:UDP-N-acetylmuramoyl-L-alanyl-D-glutamate--2,6-diaminopimelate ligase [Tepidisphaeraceae bacterium]
MELLELLRQFDPKIKLNKSQNVTVTGVEEDSRKVRPGTVFVARGGTKTDGRKYIADAIARGAVAVVGEIKFDEAGVPQVVVQNSAAARVGNAFYGHPSQTVKTLGITGTNGKTTTTYLIRHLLKKTGRKCGMVGTVEIDDGKTTTEAEMTTPGAIDVARLLARMKTNGCRACAMEVSSHALDQNRVAEVQFAGAGFTNLTGDHLDYHKTMENYAAAKGKLFQSLNEDAVAVYNADDPNHDKIIRGCRGRLISFGIRKNADYSADKIEITSQGSKFTLVTPGGSARVNMSLIGKHNIENALTAAALVGEVFGAEPEQIAEGLHDATGAPGRLQSVNAGQPFAVLVDYAHTDDALENVLRALRPLTRGKLRVLFGCGGDRDNTKRPRMAKVARKFADAVYVTSDNPRTEIPEAIIAEILTGFSPGYSPACVEPDRRTAIARILHDAGVGDVVLLAGKGHENYQIIGTTKHHFDDIEETRKILQSACAAA